MRAPWLIVKRVRPALSRVAYLAVVCFLSAIAGVLMASEMGLVVSRSDYRYVVSKFVTIREELSRLVIGNVLLIALLENPPAGSRVVMKSGILGIVSVGGDEPSGRTQGFWRFALVPPPTSETWPETSKAIREALASDGGVSVFLDRAFGFKLEDVEWMSGTAQNQNGEVRVEFIYYLSRSDLVPPEPKTIGIFNEMYSWMSRDGSSALGQDK
jgi:hypothetical protein